MSSEDESNPCGIEPLYCLSCENALTDEDCENAGSYVKCSSDSYCFRRVTQIDSSESEISRGCMSKEQCVTTGSDNEDCVDLTDENMISECTACSYFTEPQYKQNKPATHCGNIEHGVCKLWGDPHLKTFDKREMRVDGFCERTFFEDYCPLNNGGTNEFGRLKISGIFIRAKPINRRSFVSNVSIEVSNVGTSYSIKLLQGLGVTLKNFESDFGVDEILTFPYTESIDFPGMVIDMVPGEEFEDVMKISLPGNVRVMWDGVKKIKIEVPKHQKGKVCGLCGDFDGDPDNEPMGQNTVDYDICQGLALPRGSWGDQAKSDDDFGNSWIVRKSDDIDCKTECGFTRE